MEAKKILNENINREFLKDLDFDGLTMLSSEIRDFLIESVSKTGGHLASNLGVVELTLMLHRAFDFEGDDALIFDVGHQSYVYKLLTGRMKDFSSLRQSGGLSGFPSREESDSDLFTLGHSSTSISMADGIASAKMIKGEKGTAVAFIGDGALTGGLCYEAFNNIGHTKKKIVIILNDNGMSISKNVGAISGLLTKVRTSKKYEKAKENVKSALSGLNGFGEFVGKGLSGFKNTLKTVLIPGDFIESLGIKYLGPVDGHDLKKLEFFIDRAKETEGPVLLHVKTIKGKGYSHAEAEPSVYHGVSSFKVGEGTKSEGERDFSETLGKNLYLLAKENSEIAVVSPAMTKGCGLSDFAKDFPERFFDCGIAEEHAVTFSSGLARDGLTPVVCTYSSFLQRAYDQMWHDVAMNNLHVVFCLDRAGFPGPDGYSHQGIYDLSYLGTIPGMAVLSAGSFSDLSKMLRYAINEHKGPIAIRYPKGRDLGLSESEFNFGKAEILKEGKALTVCAEGIMTKTCLEAAKIAEKAGVDAEILKISTVSPLDMESIEKSFAKTGKLITVEANVKRGGMGEAIKSQLSGDVTILSFPDKFIEHGKTSDLLKKYNLDAEALARIIIEKAGGSLEA